MPDPPHEVHYDFACQAKAYGDKRVGYWLRLTAFFHDWFHGIKHKCSCCFRQLRARMGRKRRANTSAAESLNSAIKKLKNMSHNMTPITFTWWLMHHMFIYNLRIELKNKEVSLAHRRKSPRTDAEEGSMVERSSSDSESASSEDGEI